MTADGSRRRATSNSAASLGLRKFKITVRLSTARPRSANQCRNSDAAVSNGGFIGLLPNVGNPEALPISAKIDIVRGLPFVVHGLPDIVDLFLGQRDASCCRYRLAAGQHIIGRMFRGRWLRHFSRPVKGVGMLTKSGFGWRVSYLASTATKWVAEELNYSSPFVDEPVRPDVLERFVADMRWRLERLEELAEMPPGLQTAALAWLKARKDIDSRKMLHPIVVLDAGVLTRMRQAEADLISAIQSIAEAKPEGPTW